MRKKIDIAILVIVLILGFLGVRNAVAIGDWWYLRTYDPPPEIAKLARDAGMNEHGVNLFYRFNPQLVGADELAGKCGPSRSRLGCVEGRSIYILAGQGQSGYNRAIVTAAHEMLHVAYERLSEQEKNILASALDTELNRPGREAIKEDLHNYPEAEYYSEAHSFVGSEVDTLGPELSGHYAQYFEDRSKTVSAFRNSPEAQ